jgi:cyclic-di-GMP-binding protein
MNFELPAITADAHPDFTDARSCSTWLHNLPLINVGPSHGRLLGQLEELNCFEMPPLERSKVLELLREPILFVQDEHAKKFTSKSVPLSKSEREIFNNVLALWEALAQGWQRCLQGLASGALDTARGSAALMCQRALWSLSQRFTEHYKVYQSVPEADWRLLHALYAFAEGCHIADQEVGHPAYKGEMQTTCSETFVQALLSDLANPNEQSPRQQVVAARWIERFARKVGITEDAPPDTGLVPLSVDLETPRGASRRPRQGAGVRYLQVDEVGKTLRKRLSRLRNGDTPEALGLGADVPPMMAVQTLTMLYHHWCEDLHARQSPRRPVQRTTELCTGMAAMHYYVTGQAFKQPGEVKELTQREREEIAMFGRVSARKEDQYIAAQVAAVEHWTMHDESLTGFHLDRPEGAGNTRFLHRQLIAVRPSDAKTFILCSIRWVWLNEAGQLALGAQLLPGAPRGVAVRATGLNAMHDKYIPAMQLPAVAALQSPESLVLPMGWYRPRRVLEVHTDKSTQVLLTAVLERGSDYERCTYEAA